MAIDWATGTWHAKGSAYEADLRITTASDWAPLPGHKERILAAPADIYGDLLSLLRKADLRIVNVETVLGEAGTPIPKGGPNLRGEAASVTSLAAVPFDVACLANNHTADFGPEGLKETISLLEGAGLRTVGAGLTWTEAARTLEVSAAGRKVAIINCAEGEECRSVAGGPGVYGMEAHRIQAQVTEARRRADVVLVIYHGGREHPPAPPPYVVDQLRQVAGARPDAVIAHHPHAPQGIELVDGVPVFYSLGNFVFLQKSKVYYRRVGYLVHLEFDAAGLAGFAITPYVIRPEGLSLMRGKERSLFLKKLGHVSDLLAERESIEALWSAFADRIGVDGFAAQLEAAGRRLRDEPVRGGAVAHNLFATEAHRELYRNAMKRIALGTFGDAPSWARELVEEWLTRLPGEAGEERVD